MRSAYSQLFDEMGDGALDAPKGDLIHWFRASDKTSEPGRPAPGLDIPDPCSLAGHGDLPAGRSGAAKKTAAATPGLCGKKDHRQGDDTKEQVEKLGGEDGIGGGKNGQDVGLTVRIEVNLPPGGDADLRRHLREH